MIDYHIHPNYSSDARGTIDEFCQSALKLGLKEICFTTHLDSDVTRDDAYVMVEGEKIDVKKNDWLIHYESSIRDADDRYRPQGLRVKLGVEVDYYPGVRHNIPDQFYETDFDVVLGSVHLFEHHAISVEKESINVFQKYTPQQLGQLYYDFLIDCVNTELFDILAHIDLYRRYGEQYYGAEITEIWKPHINRLSKVMKQKGVSFEVNTSSWRKNLTDPMPTSSLIKALVDRGIDTITIGSDAHYPEMIGNGIQRVLRYLQDTGVQAVSTFDRRKPRKIPIKELIHQ